jgi:uncharacterized protein YutE (UPF0331/DUF86 family)
MNRERLLKIIEDMTEVIANLKECKSVLKSDFKDNRTIFIEFGLKQIFVDFFITVENLTSMILKELNKYKIGIDMKESLTILKDNNIIDDNVHYFLNEARLFRNRISHRYKEPSRDELIEFVDINLDEFDKIIDIAKSYMK